MTRSGHDPEQFRGKVFLMVPGNLGGMGGAERQSILLGTHLRDVVGARVVFLGWTREGVVMEELRRLRFEVLQFPLYWGTSRFRKGLNYARLAHFIRQNVRPDYILPYVGFHCKVIGSVWRLTGATYTWWNQRDEGRLIYGSALDRWLIRTLPDVISNSWEGKRFLIETCGASDERVRVVNNAVVVPAESDGRDWRARFGLERGDRLILMVANLTKYKDHSTLLRAFAALTAIDGAGTTNHLVLAGRDGEKTTELKALGFDLNLSGRVHFVGYVTDLNPLYAAADLVVHSSVREGCPNGVLEAMAHGKCVIGTDIDGLRHALGPDLSGCCLAAPYDHARLATLMQFFLQEDEKRSEAGSLNRQRIAREFSIEKHTDEVLSGICAYERAESSLPIFRRNRSPLIARSRALKLHPQEPAHPVANRSGSPTQPPSGEE